MARRTSWSPKARSICGRGRMAARRDGRALQKRPAVGAIFTRPRPAGGFEGMVPGTLSFDVARWNHARAGDILVSSNWSDDGTQGLKARRGTVARPATAPGAPTTFTTR